MRELIWDGCYAGGWGDLIVGEAFAHPAKFARGLIERILTHGLGRGYWRVGSTIGDPFGGVALGGVMAGYHGINWVGVELEPRFVALGGEGYECDGVVTDGKTACGDTDGHEPHHVRGNLELHRPRWAALDYRVDIRLIQGDSRHFAEVVAQAAGIVTSPPYADSIQGEHGERESAVESQAARRTPGGSLGQSQRHGGYGQTPGQIGRLKGGPIEAVVTSPPYAASLDAGGPVGESVKRAIAGRKQTDTQYGDTPGQIGRLKGGPIEAVVTSPPFAAQTNSGGAGTSGIVRKWCEQNGRNPEAASSRGVGQDKQWGEAAGQIGNLKAKIVNSKSAGPAGGESYWQAMRGVYEQCWLALADGGVMAVVVKDYVKGGKRMPLVDDTMALLVAVGFEPIERVRAMLVREDVKPDLFGGTIVAKKDRKSFFRRLAEKNGAPPIDYEEVLFVQRGPVGAKGDKGQKGVKGRGGAPSPPGAGLKRPVGMGAGCEGFEGCEGCEGCEGFEGSEGCEGCEGCEGGQKGVKGVKGLKGLKGQKGLKGRCNGYGRADVFGVPVFAPLGGGTGSAVRRGEPDGRAFDVGGALCVFADFAYPSDRDGLRSAVGLRLLGSVRQDRPESLPGYGGLDARRVGRQYGRAGGNCLRARIVPTRTNWICP